MTFSSPAPAAQASGFPSPAGDYAVASLDLNAYLVSHREATFFLRARGGAMSSAGIQNDDLLVVDRAIGPAHGDIVIAVVDGEFMVRRLGKRAGRISLHAAQPGHSPLFFGDGQELQLWGVVTHVIHSLRP